MDFEFSIIYYGTLGRLLPGLEDKFVET